MIDRSTGDVDDPGEGVHAMLEAFDGIEDGRSSHRLGRSAQCFGCGAPPRGPAQAADLATPWLVPAEGGAVGVARYCRACAPTGTVGEIECAGCGDGPLLAEELADTDLLTGAAVDAWLTETGWRPAGPWCPDCDLAHHGRRRKSRRSA
jgi:hypothetical protein